MKKKKVYYYPPGEKEGGYGNPYSANYKFALGKYFDVFEKDNKKRIGLRSVHLLIYSFFADIFILNWIEKIGAARYGWIQQFLTKLSICIMRLRKKQVVWMFHNIHPHKGEQKRTKELQAFLFKKATLIISHSTLGADYAKGKAFCPVVYSCHPVAGITIDTTKSYQTPLCDVLIWGSIYSYKGIAEFLELKEIQQSNLRVHVIGVCKEKQLEERINNSCSSSITYENRKADMSEIASFCKSSRYVLFPYIGDSISSSGALIDTIVLGGNPVGPNVGAFKDTSEIGVCLTYKDTRELMEILNSNNKIDENNREEFLKDNTWDKFAYRVYKLLDHE